MVVIIVIIAGIDSSDESVVVLSALVQNQMKLAYSQQTQGERHINTSKCWQESSNCCVAFVLYHINGDDRNADDTII
jgi:hypothetical protein